MLLVYRNVILKKMVHDNEVELIDIEDYKGGKDQKFSHQVLVMKIIGKCIEAGSKEMRSGYYNTKADRFGNSIKVYVPDSRKEFIETVKTAMNIISRDYDSTATEDIKAVVDKMSEEYKRLIELEGKGWNNLIPRARQARWAAGIFHQPKTLNIKLNYYHEYLEFEVDCHRKILTILQKLIKRNRDYEEEDYEA